MAYSADPRLTDVSPRASCASAGDENHATNATADARNRIFIGSSEAGLRRGHWAVRSSQGQIPFSYGAIRNIEAPRFTRRRRRRACGRTIGGGREHFRRSAESVSARGSSRLPAASARRRPTTTVTAAERGPLPSCWSGSRVEALHPAGAARRNRIACGRRTAQSDRCHGRRDDWRRGRPAGRNSCHA